MTTIETGLGNHRRRCKNVESIALARITLTGTLAQSIDLLCPGFKQTYLTTDPLSTSMQALSLNPMLDAGLQPDSPRFVSNSLVCGRCRC